MKSKLPLLPADATHQALQAGTSHLSLLTSHLSRPTRKTSLRSRCGRVTSEGGSAAISVLIIIVVALFAAHFSGFFTFRKYDPSNTSSKKYIVVEGPNFDGKGGLNIIELKIEEYSTPTPIPTEPPPPPPTIEIPTPTFGPSPTPRPTRIPTPTPSAPTPTPFPTTPPPPPYVPG